MNWLKALLIEVPCSLLKQKCSWFFPPDAWALSVTKIVTIFAGNVPLVSLIFLKRSLVFPNLLFSPFICINLWWRLSSLSLLFSETILSWVYFSLSPLPFASLLFSVVCKASSDNHFAFLHFFFLGMVLVTTSQTTVWTSVHTSFSTLANQI